MTKSIHDLFTKLFSQWIASGSAPESPIEGTSPEFANLLGVQPQDFTFDTFLHTAKVAAWSWKPIEFPELFEGYFYFYLPDAWTAVQQKARTATFGDASGTRQALFLTDKLSWQPRLSELLKSSHVVAFVYYPLLQPSYDQWVFVTQADEASPPWVYAAYRGSDWLVMVKANVPTTAEVNTQLVSLVTSSPWHGWIKAAKAR